MGSYLLKGEMEDYMDQNYVVMFIGDSSFAIFSIKMGTMTQNMVDLIEGPGFETFMDEPAERQDKCRQVIEFYNDSIVTVAPYVEGHYEIPTDIDFDYGIETSLSLDFLIAMHPEKILYLDRTCECPDDDHVSLKQILIKISDFW